MNLRRICLALTLVTLGASGDHQITSPIANFVVVNPNIGAPPPIDLEEYAPYAKTGKNLLAFPWVLQFNDKSYKPCSPTHDSAVLYPATPYTRWLIHRFILDTVGHREVQGRLYPGDTGFAVAAPTFLRPYVPGSIVHHASCVGGWIAFRNLPVGRYIAVGDIGDVVEGGSPATKLTVEATFNPVLGTYEEATKREFDPHSTIDMTVGGYLMVSKEYDLVENSNEPLTNTAVGTFGHYAL